MMGRRIAKIALAVTLAVTLVGGIYLAFNATRQWSRNTFVAYFENTNGVFVGDDVRIRGVNVGRIEAIEPEPDRAKVTLAVDSRHKVPAAVNAVILSPTRCLP